MRRSQRLTMVLAIGAASSLIFATGCGGCDDDDQPDARIIYDAGPTFDADDTDAVPPDAGPQTTHTGQLTIADIEISGLPAAGHGLKTFFTFTAVPEIEPLFDNRVPPGVGCVAYVYDLTTDTPPEKEGHGPITVTGTEQTFPDDCIFLGTDYICPADSGDASDDNITIDGFTGGGPNPIQGLFVFTDDNATFQTNPAAGRYLAIHAANTSIDYPWNGAFPISAVLSETSIVIVNTAPAAQLNLSPNPAVLVDGPGIGIRPTTEQLDADSTYDLVVGAGPIPQIPGLPPVDGIADDDAVIVSLDAPDDDPAFDDFTTGAIPAGDSFSMDPDSFAKFVAIPTDGSGYTLSCDDDVASFTGTGPSFAFDDGTDTVTLTDSTTDAFANVRVGAEVTIGAATVTNNNGTYTITAQTANTISYVNANGEVDSFAADTNYIVKDCGEASVSAVSMDFNNGLPYIVLAHAEDTGPTITAAGGYVTITHANAFSPNLFGRPLTIAGLTGDLEPLNGSDYTVIQATANTVTAESDVTASGDFVAGSSYTVYKFITGLPDESTATKAGSISCASLTTTVTVAAEASAAIQAVDPTVIQATFIRSAFQPMPNDDVVNTTNVLVGHGKVSFTSK